MLHVGFAETDITPKLGSQSPGGMQARRLNVVHDPLKAVAMVIKSEQAPSRSSASTRFSSPRKPRPGRARSSFVIHAFPGRTF